MNIFVVALNCFLFWNLSARLLRERHSACGAGGLFPPLASKQETALFLFFAAAFLFYQALSFWIFLVFASPALVLSALLFVKRRKERNLIPCLERLLAALPAKMRLGFGFTDAFRQCLADMEDKKAAGKLQEILDSLRFNKACVHPDRNVREFVSCLNQARLSGSPLKRLRRLQEKVKTERLFQRKASRALMQLRLQSVLLTVIYSALLIWTLSLSGLKHLNLIFLSFFFFLAGLIWIFRAGRKMKWSL